MRTRRVMSVSRLILVIVWLSGGELWSQESKEENPEVPQTTPEANLGEEQQESQQPDLKFESNRAEIADPFRPMYIVESIEVRGNQKTRGNIIISQLQLQPGDTLVEEKVEESRIRLLSLGYFRDVHMGLEKGSKRGRVRLIIEVEERNTIIMDDLFLGFSATNPFWGGIGVSDINFLGRGLVLSGGFVASEYQQAYRLGVFWPSVFNSRFQAGVQFLFSQGDERTLQDHVNRCDPEKDTCTISGADCNNLTLGDQDMPYLRVGGILSGGINLDRSHRVTLEWHGEHIESDMGGLRNCPNYPFRGFLRNEQSTFSSLTFRFERDTRDDYFMATSGMHFQISIEVASRVFGSDYEFSKYQIQYEHSFQPWWDHAIRLSLVAGLIQDVGNKGSPFFSRFFVGDYAFFLINKDTLPRNLELNFSESVFYGDLLASLTMEYDVPLWSTGKFFYRGYVYAAVNFCVVDKTEFFGPGANWEGWPRNPVTVDLGFKFDTPIGLLTLSFGYLLDLVY